MSTTKSIDDIEASYRELTFADLPETGHVGGRQTRLKSATATTVSS